MLGGEGVPGSIKILGSAIRAVDVVLISVQPTGADIDKIAEVLDAIDEASTYNENLKTYALLTRVVKRTTGPGVSRTFLEEQGVTVLESVIHQKQAYSWAFGHPLEDISEYADVLIELTKGH